METPFLKSCPPSLGAGTVTAQVPGTSAGSPTHSHHIPVGPVPMGASRPYAGTLCDPSPSLGSPDAGVPQAEPLDSRADLRVRPGCRQPPPSALYHTAGPSPSAFPQRQTWVFKSKEQMVKASSAVPEGSLVYVQEGSNAFLRTPTGWSRLLVLCGIPHRAGRAGCRAGFGTRAADPQEGEDSP